jgi:hypothetical protein
MFANFWKRDTMLDDSAITSFLGAVDVPAALEAIPRPSCNDFVLFLKDSFFDLATLKVSLIVSYINLASLAV